MKEILEQLENRRAQARLGWLATMPTLWPSMRAKPITMFFA